jgi:hypothetical protein
MAYGNLTCEVSPMIDHEPPNAAETGGASLRTRFCATSGSLRPSQPLPDTPEQRMVGREKPALEMLASYRLFLCARAARLSMQEERADEAR